MWLARAEKDKSATTASYKMIAANSSAILVFILDHRFLLE